MVLEGVSRLKRQEAVQIENPEQIIKEINRFKKIKKVPYLITNTLVPPQGQCISKLKNRRASSNCTSQVNHNDDDEQEIFKKDEQQWRNYYQ